MDIIERGTLVEERAAKARAWRDKVKCRNCGSKLAITASDVCLRWEADVFEHIRSAFVTCPVCGEIVPRGVPDYVEEYVLSDADPLPKER